MLAHLSLKSLMLLDLCLKVGGVLVALVRRGLELFVDPGLELVGVSPEVLEPARFLQLLPLDLRGLLELDIPSEDLDIDEIRNLIKTSGHRIFIKIIFLKKISCTLFVIHFSLIELFFDQ